MNKILHCALLCLIVSIATLAHAKELLNKTDTQEIKSKTAEIALITKEGRFSEIIDFMPPDFFEFMASKIQLKPEQFKQKLKQQTQAYADSITIKNYELDFDKAVKNTSNKSRTYVFIPTKTVFEMNNEENIVKGHLLCIKNDENWYFLAWQDSLANIIWELYPDLDGVSPPEQK